MEPWSSDSRDRKPAPLRNSTNICNLIVSGPLPAKVLFRSIGQFTLPRSRGRKEFIKIWENWIYKGEDTTSVEKALQSLYILVTVCNKDSSTVVVPDPDCFFTAHYCY
uniref:UBC core domain-containing protein n=1 Tax=Steinernema glaseri TaxID=37863 RepID=A0A1I8AHS9_9BILA